jgi:hypothetical protein
MMKNISVNVVFVMSFKMPANVPCVAAVAVLEQERLS